LYVIIVLINRSPKRIVQHISWRLLLFSSPLTQLIEVHQQQQEFLQMDERRLYHPTGTTFHVTKIFLTI
jgi:hypothetical protein